MSVVANMDVGRHVVSSLGAIVVNILHVERLLSMLGHLCRCRRCSCGLCECYYEELFGQFDAWYRKSHEGIERRKTK